MRYYRQILLSKSVADEITHLLNVEPKSPEETLGEDEMFRYTAVFSNGYEMDVKCCGVQWQDNASNLCWSEAVLFDENGIELAYTEPSEEYLGEWSITYNGNEYVADVVVDNEFENEERSN